LDYVTEYSNPSQQFGNKTCIFWYKIYYLYWI